MEHHFALFTRAPGAAGNLSVELGEAFRRTKICGKKRAIDVQQRHQRDVRKVMAFRQHLCAYQNARSAAVNFRQMLLQRAFTTGGITVDS